MKKKLLCFALAVCMIASMAVAPAAAAEDISFPEDPECAAWWVNGEGGQRYVVGFYGQDDNEDYFVYDSGIGAQDRGEEHPDANALLRKLVDLQIMALKEGSDGELAPDDANYVKIQVESMTLVSDKSNVFSLSSEEIVTEWNGQSDFGASLYARAGNPGQALVSAKVTVNVDGKEQTVTVSLYCVVDEYEQPQFAFYTSSTASEETKIANNSELCYYTLGETKSVWLIGDKTFTGDEVKSIRVRRDGEELYSNDSWDGSAVKIELEVPVDWGYNLQATSGMQDCWINITSLPVSDAAEFTYNGKNYTVGFSTGGDWIFGDSDRISYTTGEGGAGAPLEEQYYLSVKAGIMQGVGNDAYYEEAEGVTVTVKNMTIEQLTGENGALSFTPDMVATTTNESSATLYGRAGCATVALIKADVTVAYGNDSFDATVALAVEARVSGLRFYTSADMDEEIPLGSEICYYTMPTPGKLWVTSAEGFGDNVEVWYGDGTAEWERVEGGGDAIVITFDVPERRSYGLGVNTGDDNGSITVSSRPNSSALYIPHEDGDCAVGFTTGGTRIFNENFSQTYTTGGEYSATAPFVEQSWFKLGAGIDQGDGEFSSVSDVGIEVVRIYIQHIHGDEGTFSFSPDRVVTETEADNARLYSREGSDAIALVCADIKATYNGKTYEGTVSVSVASERTGLSFYTTAEMDEDSKVSVGSWVSYYTMPNRGELWVTSKNAFGENVEVTADNSPVSYERIDDNTIRIYGLPAPAQNSGYYLEVSNGSDSAGISINSNAEGSCIRVNVGSNEYIAGFAFAEGDDVTTINEGNWTYGGSTTVEYDPDNPYMSFRSVGVDVGRREVDANGQAYYLVDKTASVRARVLSMEIIPLYGGSDDFAQTFSFSRDGCELELDSVIDNSAEIYVKSGYTACALLTATVEVRQGGKTSTGTVSVVLRMDRGTEIEPLVRPENDTVDALNAALQEAAEDLPQGGNGTIYVTLNAQQYEGTIVLPANLFDLGDYEIFFTSPSGTTIVGGIDLNGSAARIYGLNFVAPEGGGVTRALYNGRANMTDCTFRGYDVAIDASANTIIPSFCVFTDNEIAARVNLPDYGNNNRDRWEGNTFINNGTAVQVLRLNEFVSPYYFRIVESNFIGNEVTFDVQCPGSIYFYRNYYGRVRNNAGDMSSAEILAALTSGNTNSIQSHPPAVSIADHSRTKVVTNPRWKDPLDLSGYDRPGAGGSGNGGSGSGGAALLAETEDTAGENYLTADWGLPTMIIHGEDDLEIDARAFAEDLEYDREITVVDNDGNTLAVWSLGRDAVEFDEPFDADVDISRDPNGEITVTVKASAEALSALEPTLTIPNASGGVEHEGDVVDSVPAGNSVTFEVSGEGDYVISQETPQTPSDPDTPDIPNIPGTPNVPEEPETPDVQDMPFADVTTGDWFYEYVAYVYANGLMDGVSDTQFNPNGTMTRAMVWAILARIDGETVTGENWAETARSWAMSNGVSDGENANGLVTREQFATMLWRYAGEPESSYSLAAYADAASVSDWAQTSMQWAVENGIITGITAIAIDPQGTAPRAQAAAMLMRFVESAD